MFIFDNSEYRIYNNLVDDLYSCSDCKEMNTILTTYLGKLIPTDSSIFMVYENDGITAKASYVVNLEEKRFVDYLNYYQEYDLYKDVIHLLDNPPVVNRVSDYLDYNQWEKNEHRVDFLKPQNIYHISCLEIIQNNKIIASLSLHRSKKHQDFNDKELAILKMIAPVIKNTYQSFQTNFLLNSFTEKLTPREKQILPMLTKDYTTIELASYFAISKNTIKTHIKNILYKTKCNSRFDLTIKLRDIKEKGTESYE